MVADEQAEGVHHGTEGDDPAAENHGRLVFPNGMVFREIKKIHEGEVHVLAVGEFVFHGRGGVCGLVLGAGRVDGADRPADSAVRAVDKPDRSIDKPDRAVDKAD